jgi:hypothetical protein
MHSNNKKKMISVIGGTYKEINLENNTEENYGSGLRSSYFLLENGVEVKFHTSGNSKVEDYLKLYKGTYSNFEFHCEISENFITFNYYFALDTPTIYPNILKINKTEIIRVLEENIVCFGMLESDFSIKGNRVIYDPQTSLRPLKFSQFGKAEQLVYIVNLFEAKSISGLEDTNEIIDFFFESEGVYALIIKNGPYGANLYYEGKTYKIPSYITDNVTKIGSGDIYTTSFAYYWIEKGLSLEQSALNASKSTAYFCDTLEVRQHELLKNFNYKEYEAKPLFDKQIYIASPIFSLSDIILVDKLRNVFLDFGVKVFSPFHDIGLGSEVDIAIKDLEGLDKSDIVFGVLDGLDAGTLIELGVSMSKNKKMIGYHRTCNVGSLLMLTPSNIKIHMNLTTSIYHTIWSI